MDYISWTSLNTHTHTHMHTRSWNVGTTNQWGKHIFLSYGRSTKVFQALHYKLNMKWRSPKFMCSHTESVNITNINNEINMYIGLEITYLASHKIHTVPMATWQQFIFHTCTQLTFWKALIVPASARLWTSLVIYTTYRNRCTRK